MSTTDITGRRHGMMTVIGYSHTHTTSGGKKQGRWKVQCDCGEIRTIPICSLKRRLSCGCKRGDNISKNRANHGWARRGDRLRSEYRIWSLMLQRCNNPKNPAYSRYGGRGIVVCGKWHKFEHFIKDMGERQHGMTLDRKDTNGNYEPDNCRWATLLEQANNRRNNKLVTVNGRTQTISEWGRETGVKIATISHRLIHGMSPSIAVSSKENHCLRKIEVDGKSKSVSEWARETGIKRATIWARLHYGWDAKSAVTTPVSH